ncbi:hypothetical protein GUJ93_ZPchr0007g3367 [Zizania palustris]|uniref:Uncharacterized protein n=1 Tax=Zizania palustris TaxID=103762 RepID=A0A8J5T2H3_ZIZPA|nr:hypothetical protein GUJ93_ZPchr0007g3367 [Zizania palustris]
MSWIERTLKSENSRGRRRGNGAGKAEEDAPRSETAVSRVDRYGESAEDVVGEVVYADDRCRLLEKERL